MAAARRGIFVGCLLLAIAALWLVQNTVAPGSTLADGVAAICQIGGPLSATLFCVLAARRSRGGERTAWTNFAVGSALYVTGNLFYLFYVLAGITVSFPSAPEVTYFLMAGFFAAGIFHHGKVREQISRIEVYNFVLICCAVLLVSLSLLARSLPISHLALWPTIVALAYPVLWFSVAAFSVASLVVYDQRGRRLVLLLLLGAVLCEAVADFRYALALIEGRNGLGGANQMLWACSALLIGWAACEQIAASGKGRVRVRSEQSARRMAQATLPAVAFAAILVCSSLTGALGGGPFALLGVAIAVLFAVVSGLREFSMIHTQQQLRGSVERSRAELTRSEARLTEVLQSTSDSILVLDRHWNVTYFNQRAAETINKTDLLAIGVSVWDLFPAALTSGEGDHYRQAVATGEPEEFEIFVQDRGIWLGISAYPAPDSLSIFFRDISERKRAHDEIVHLAHHDSLTGLANRALFQDRLKWALDAGGNVAVLVLDLDHFKEVNDTLGHPVGDALLSRLAERLRACMQPGDMIARLGGDEFAVIVSNFSERINVVQLVQKLLAAANMAQLVEGQSIRIGASVGIALADASCNDADRLFKNADIALYVAKAEARGSYCFFEPNMEAGLQERQTLRADLAMALDNDEFELVYQPLLDLKANAICGFEALLRWRHPRHGMMRPDLFIPIAEETGLIVDIGNWVLRQACAEAAKWPLGVSVAVNLSTRQFRDDALVSKVSAALAETGFDSARLELEITESVLLNDSKANTVTLKRLKELGVRIALDDFGTGYSSLGYLQKFQFDKLKIDRSFISGLPDNEESQAIVRAVIGLGRSLGMRVTAEGVETPEQMEWVRNGCDEAQGYLLSKPVPANGVNVLLEKFGTRAVAPAKRRKTVPSRRLAS